MAFNKAISPQIAGEFLRDPIHGEINFAGDTLWLRELVDTPEFQRILNIKQLGPKSRFFPGATHTRGAHCLGVYETTRRMLQNSSFAKIKPIDQQTLLAAALLHDIGHAPHSHAFEDYFYEWCADANGKGSLPFVHETMSVRLILREEGNVNRLLRKNGIAPERVAALIEHRHKNTDVLPWMLQLVSSELDMDRIDYLLRDSYYAGVAFGTIDVNSLLHWAYFDEQKQLVTFANRAVTTIENFLLGRYHMYETLYLNEHSQVAVAVLGFVFMRIAELDAAQKFDWGQATACRDVLRVLFAHKTTKDIDLSTFLMLSDATFDTFLLHTYQTTKDPILSNLLHSYFANNKFVICWFNSQTQRDRVFAELSTLPNARYALKKHSRYHTPIYAPKSDTQRIWIINPHTHQIKPLERISELVVGATNWLANKKEVNWGLLVHRDFIKINHVAKKLALVT